MPPAPIAVVWVRTEGDNVHRLILRRYSQGIKQQRKQKAHEPPYTRSSDSKTPSLGYRRLVIGTGAFGRLPVMKEVKREAERRKVELLVIPTSEAIKSLTHNAKETNSTLHLTR